jgi:hypothetical protein
MLGMRLRRRFLFLTEATISGHAPSGGSFVWDDSSNVSPREVDPVGEYERWRRACPDYDKPGHAAFCPRCDAFLHPIGGVDYEHEDPRGRIATALSPGWPDPRETPASLYDRVVGGR